MSLSKKNLDKLIKLKKNKNLNKNSAITSNNTKIDNKDNFNENLLNLEDPNKIFYSLIDNLESLDETSKVNHLLRNSEINQINMHSRKTSHSYKLTAEEELYDEFNYLLES